MTKVKILALLVGMGLMFIIPAVAFAQPPIHAFSGTVTIDGAAAPDGTTVSVWINGAEVQSITVSGGTYVLVVDDSDGNYDGKSTSFLVNGMAAAETITFERGALSIDDEAHNLTASSTPVTPGRILTLDLGELNDSGQSGTATLTELGPNTEVVLSLSAGSLETELVHIHLGQCGDSLGGVDRALTSFVGVNCGDLRDG